MTKKNIIQELGCFGVSSNPLKIRKKYVRMDIKMGDFLMEGNYKEADKIREELRKNNIKVNQRGNNIFLE